MRITKVYTRAGDRGSSSLADGSVVPKNDLRLEAYGTTDELSSALGVVRSAAESMRPGNPTEEASRDLLLEHIRYIQNQLFTLGGDLATPLSARVAGMPVVTQEHVDYLERLIDAMNASLPPLEDFVLPGGPPAATHLHLARCICRRAERSTQALAGREDVGAFVIPYLNRLSDVLFVMARWITRAAGAGESVWSRELDEPPLPGTPETR